MCFWLMGSLCSHLRTGIWAKGAGDSALKLSCLWLGVLHLLLETSHQGGGALGGFPQIRPDETSIRDLLLIGTGPSGFKAGGAPSFPEQKPSQAALLCRGFWPAERLSWWPERVSEASVWEKVPCRDII